MTLPKFADASRNLVIPVGEDTVTLQLQPVPGYLFDRILEKHRNPETKRTMREDCAREMLTAGIRAAYSNIESNPTPFNEKDADEIWSTWPEWARSLVYDTIVAYSTAGPDADPKDGTPKNGNDA